MKKLVFPVVLIGVFLLFSVVLAHGAEDEMMSGNDSAMMNMDNMMNMDKMMSDLIKYNKNVDCSMLDSHELIEKGEEMMEKMLNNDHEKHELFEESMEQIAGEDFHDMMHIMMGRNATGCFSEEEKNLITAKLGAETLSSKGKQISALAVGIIIGGILGALAISYFKKSA